MLRLHLHARQQMLRIPASFLAVALMLAVGVGPGASGLRASDDNERHPAHIHDGSCESLGGIAVPLTDVAYEGMMESTPTAMDETVGAQSAVPVKTSATIVDLPLAQIADGTYAINVHESAEQIDVYIACGDIGGQMMGETLVVGVQELNDSGHVGVAVLEGMDAQTQVTIHLLEQGARTEPSSEAAAGTPAAEAAGDTVAVSLTEYMIAMPAELPAGPTTFSITNDGTVEHNFEVEGQGIEEELAENLAPGASGTLEVDLQPGSYEIYCPVGHHADEGMRVELTVTE